MTDSCIPKESDAVVVQDHVRWLRENDRGDVADAIEQMLAVSRVPGIDVPPTDYPPERELERQRSINRGFEKAYNLLLTHYGELCVKYSEGKHDLRQAKTELELIKKDRTDA